MDNKTFKWRSFVSFGMFFSFLIMSITGLILYIAPPEITFKLVNWRLLWINLEQWQALHTLFSYLFLGFAISHIFFMNWKILFSYFTRKTKEGLRRKRELISSSIIILIFVFGTLFRVPPFQSIMDFGGWISKTWGDKIDYAPAVHAGEITIEEIARELLNISSNEYLNRIQAAGFEVINEKQKLEDVCLKNNVAPYEFFRKTTEGLNALVIP